MVGACAVLGCRSRGAESGAESVCVRLSNDSRASLATGLRHDVYDTAVDREEEEESVVKELML